MKLTHFGEDRLVAQLTRALKTGAAVRLGVGDDCAVIGARTARVWQLLKTDCLVEGVHFTGESGARQVGWKALARAASDIAAMSGVPKFALITMAVSGDENVARVKGIYAGLRRAADAFGVQIVGGETSRSPGPMFISVALTGEVERTRCVSRSGGRIGDVVYVSGRLGGSIRGKHLTFIPRLREARWLTANFRIRAMMDLSDGLAADLPRLAKASGCGFEISKQLVPITKACTLAQALSDGEDYELLFTLAPASATELERQWRGEFPRLPLTRIGRLISKSKSRKPKLPRGFDHFA